MHSHHDVLPYMRLQFHIEHVDLEDCFQQGHEEAQQGIAITANPYTENSLAAEHWDNGWWEGFYEEKSAVIPTATYNAVNDAAFEPMDSDTLFIHILRISGALFASMLIGYQIFDLVA